MKAIYSVAKNHYGLQEEFWDSLKPTKILLSILFQILKLIHKPYNTLHFSHLDKSMNDLEY